MSVLHCYVQPTLKQCDYVKSDMPGHCLARWVYIAHLHMSALIRGYYAIIIQENNTRRKYIIYIWNSIFINMRDPF